MSIRSLPAELVEHVLISAAAAGFPHAIASFAQTSKAHRGLVYSPKDQHLWREIFLTTFDDPRASGGGPGWGECTSSLDRSHDTFHWGSEFRKRVWAAGYIRRHTDPLSRISDEPFFLEDDLKRTLIYTRAFDILLSVVRTALPCPPTIVFSFLPPQSLPGPPVVQPNTFPTFPPLPQAIGGFSSSIVAAGSTDASGRTFEEGMRARNPAWLDAVLTHGLPQNVTQMLSGDNWQGGQSDQFLSEPEFCEMQAAGHLIACTGFKPVPQLPAADSPRRSETDTEHASVSGGLQSVVHSKPPYMSIENQLKRARRLARMRVYNMRYLTRDRHWGPFLPLSWKNNNRARAAESRVDDELFQPILALFHTTPHQHQHTHVPAHAFELGNDGPAVDGGHGDDDDDDGTQSSSEDGAATPEVTTENTDRPPSSAQLHPDWSYLAAVRMVVEANLRDSVPPADLRGLFSLDGLRPGSAPWDASVYKRPEGDEAGSAVSDESKEKKETAGEDDEVEGWDWAGVNGVWKRCVCWLDYRDLILHNLPGETEDPHLQEAVRIVTMRLRVKGYSPALTPAYTHLPTIHVEGETVGGGAGASRRMHGTVSVLADGSVRWTLVSTVENDGNMDEWVSESVQVGGVASAMGLLGMWTGANHERMDPLGPTWAWKVG